MLSEITKADLFRQDGLTGVKGFIKAWRYPGFRYVYMHRKQEKCKNNLLLTLFFKLYKRRYKIKYGYEISSGAQLGEGFHLSSHSGHVIVGPIKIGKNCNINHSVTIGRAYKKGILGRPTIGNHVWIGTGSVIVGDITIGNYVLIAPNSYVNFDVPDNSLVIGNPATIYRKDNPVQYYIVNVLESDDKV